MRSGSNQYSDSFLQPFHGEHRRCQLKQERSAEDTVMLCLGALPTPWKTRRRCRNKNIQERKYQLGATTHKSYIPRLSKSLTLRSTPDFGKFRVAWLAPVGTTRRRRLSGNTGISLSPSRPLTLTTPAILSAPLRSSTPTGTALCTISTLMRKREDE